MSAILSKVISENLIIEEDIQKLQKEHNNLKGDLLSYFEDQKYGGTATRRLSRPLKVHVQSIETECTQNS